MGSPAERVQLVLDWHHDMQRKGKAVALRFSLDMLHGFYHQLQSGEPLRRGQLASLDKVIRKWYIDASEKNYPRARGKAPAPKFPVDQGSAFCSDDE